MLIVDKLKEQVRFIVTVTESTITATPTYVMKVHSSFSQKTFYLPLPANTSPFPQRYDEFIVSTTEFIFLESGTYSYEISEMTDGVVEQGVLMIKDSGLSGLSGYTTITPEAEDDDFIIYQG